MKVRGQNWNRNTVKQTAENGQKISVDDDAAGFEEFCMLWLPWATHRKEWLQMAVWTATRAASLVPGVKNSRLRNGPVWTGRYTFTTAGRQRSGSG